MVPAVKLDKEQNMQMPNVGIRRDGKWTWLSPAEFAQLVNFGKTQSKLLNGMLKAHRILEESKAKVTF